MDHKRKLKSRDLYLAKLKGFQDTEPVKVVTGIRRCGKSSLLKLMVQHLKDSGIKDDQIIEMNFESFDFHNMDDAGFYNYVKARSIPNKRMYLFFDEVQHVTRWEDVVNAFRVDLDCDIYVTGSNAYMLSSEYSTYLSGRCVEIKMLPLSFREFIDFYGFHLRESTGAFGEKRKLVSDQDGNPYEIRELFNIYLRYGGMPGLAETGLNQERAMILLDGIYSTVVVRDILERETLKNQTRVTDPALLRKIILFLADNLGSRISLSSIGNTLADEGLVEKKGKRSKPSVITVQNYVNALIEAYFFYEIKRFDIRGKEYLRTLGKYYIVDPGLRNYLLGFRDRDRGHILENIVYFELLRRGYDVSVGKIGTAEVDFVAVKADEKIYFQVTESMLDEKVREREIAALQKIKDNYPKVILSLEPGFDDSYEGISSVHVLDWMLEPYH